MAKELTAASLDLLPENVKAIQIPVSDRIARFDVTGTLVADVKAIGELIAGREGDLVDVFWDAYLPMLPAERRPSREVVAGLKPHGIRNTQDKFNMLGSQRWADGARDHIALTTLQGGSATALRAALNTANRKVVEIVALEVEDTQRRSELLQALLTLYAIEADIMSAYLIQHSERSQVEGRSRSAQLFNEQIGSEVVSASSLGAQLRTQAGAASQATRGMLGKASEVAAAAEQSATAMRDAAHTAAGLIRAIEEARGEVEVAADVATRAAAQASEAVNVSQALTDTAKSIESILGLIRDVAGQTNLLALNATIEAARAGDAGRGFAVVAQEVKSLANQTARATDDIAGNILAIQSATQSTVVTSGAIRDTVAEVQASASRIRSAMDAQAQTVTMITAAVDETALAADTMSTTIAAIRQDTEEVAGEIDALETGFASVNDKLAKLQSATTDYVKLVA